MGKTTLLTCDLCGAKDAHELPSWFEWAMSIQGVEGNLFRNYISGVSSRGWSRYSRTIYLCEDHHVQLDELIGRFANKIASSKKRGES